MRVTFCGVGEAFDEQVPNTSILLEHEGRSILLDCGFTAASAFWRHASEPMDLSAVVVSHFHGDHYFGLPALLVRFMEHGRREELAVVGQAGVEEKVGSLMELAYPGTLDKADFGLAFVESAPGRTMSVGGFVLSFAAGDHPQPCLAVRAEAGGRAVFYSGDGRPTDETLALASGVDLAVQEAFRLEDETPGHATVDGALDFARQAGVSRLALVHLQRDVRRTARAALGSRLEKGGEVSVFVPQPGEIMQL